MLIATATSPTTSIARLFSSAKTGTMTTAAAANSTASRASQRCPAVPGRSARNSAAVTGRPPSSPERNALVPERNGSLGAKRRPAPLAAADPRATMATMASANDDAAAMLREYAELLSITGGDPSRARNYEKAAKAVAGYPGDLGAVPDPALTKIPGVGTS